MSWEMWARQVVESRTTPSASLPSDPAHANTQSVACGENNRACMRKTEMVRKQWKRGTESGGGPSESPSDCITPNIRLQGEEWSFIQLLQSCANRAVSSMWKKVFVNSCCLVDPWLIFPWRSRIFYVQCVCVCVANQSMLRVSHGCSSCCSRGAILYTMSVMFPYFKSSPAHTKPIRCMCRLLGDHPIDWSMRAFSMEILVFSCPPPVVRGCKHAGFRASNAASLSHACKQHHDTDWWIACRCQVKWSTRWHKSN